MIVQRCIARGAEDTLVGPHGDVVGVIVRGAKLGSEAKVDDMELRGRRSTTEDEIVGLDITMDEIARMESLDESELQEVSEFNTA